jgi:hypothetical protein
MMATGALDLRPLVSHRFNIRDASKAYGVLVNERSALGIMLAYDGATDGEVTRHLAPAACRVDLKGRRRASRDRDVGAGNCGSRVLIPALKAAGARLDTIVTSAGVSGFHHGSKAGLRAPRPTSNARFWVPRG